MSDIDQAMQDALESDLPYDDFGSRIGGDDWATLVTNNRPHPRRRRPGSDDDFHHPEDFREGDDDQNAYTRLDVADLRLSGDIGRFDRDTDD